MSVLRGALIGLAWWAGLSTIGLAVYGIARATTRTQRDYWPELADWEAHIATTPGMTDWAPHAPMFDQPLVSSASPIYDQLAAETLAAELTVDDATARWLA